MNNAEDLLKYAMEHGMIDLSYVQNEIQMEEKLNLLSQHPYKIWHGKDGNWYTYVPDEKSKRKLKRRKSKDEIENVIINFWKEKEENPTVSDLFFEWLNGKFDRKEIEPSTRDRYKRQFLDCFVSIADAKIKKISEYDIEKFCLNIIHEKQLTSKGFSNMRTIIFGIFKLAKKKGYIDFSISQTMNDMEISKKAFRKPENSDEEEVFLKNELSKISNYIQDNPDLINLGILLMFKTGLRIGELSALKKEDVSYDNIIHVKRTEVKYSQGHGMIYEVRDFPKTEAGIRDVIIPDKYRWILRKIRLANPFGEYLFERNGDRIRTYVFRNRLRTICRRLNIHSKSPHKARKTYATLLLNSGVPESLVKSQMGHTEIKTTKQYYYKDMETDAEKKQRLNLVEGL